MYHDKDDFNGIFSFVPCSKEGAFARPIVKLDNVINPMQKQGIKISSNQDVVKQWGQITQQIFNQGLCLMIKNKSPKKFEI